MKQALWAGVAAGLLTAFGGMAANAAEDYVSYAGHWVWNAKESHHAANALPQTAEEMLDITDDSGKLHISDAYVMADGTKGTREYTGAFDGKKRQIGDGMAASYKHVSPASFSDSWSVKGIGHGKELCTFSDDHATLTCKGHETLMKKKTAYVDVWNKS